MFALWLRRVRRCARTADIDDALKAFDRIQRTLPGPVDRPVAAVPPPRGALPPARLLMSDARSPPPELAAKSSASTRCSTRSRALLASVEARLQPRGRRHAAYARDSVAGVKIGIFSLNTGRLHAETLGMLERVKERYGYDIELFHPQRRRRSRRYVGATRPERVLRKRRSAQALLRHPQGRAAEPRAGRTSSAWVTGQRREQSVTRAELHDARSTTPRTASPSSIRWPTGPRARCGTTSSAIDVPVNRAARPRLSEHRLRAVHARGPSRRRQPRRPLVVGAARHEGMRPAHHDIPDRVDSENALELSYA